MPTILAPRSVLRDGSGKPVSCFDALSNSGNEAKVNPMSPRMHFALIDRYSGLIAWVGEASSPEIACAIGHAEANPGHVPKGFERVPSTSVDAGFDVYEVPAGPFDEAEHDDATAIAAVRCAAFLGMYQSIAPADLADSY
jgi:hypothetical protein